MTRLMVLLLLVFNLILCGNIYAGNITASSCSLADVQSAIDNAQTVNGDIVTIPAETCTWGTGSAYLSVNKKITVTGISRTGVVINLANDSTSTGDSGVIRISAGGTVKTMTINGSSAKHVTPLSVSSVRDYRISDITYNGTAFAGKFVYVSFVYGLIDNCTLNINHGSFESIWMRGPADSWQTPSSIGGADNLFVEDCIVNGTGYFSDINANGRAVFRYNTINGSNKIDGHGLASNSPARSVRHMEVYNNHWTNLSNFWQSIAIRGGTWLVYDNILDNETSYGAAIQVRDYCINNITTNYVNCDSEYKCPEDYPIQDQVGRGFITADQDLEPMYLWNNSRVVQAEAATYFTEANEYCAIKYGRTETFTMEDIIRKGRDYFESATKPEAMAGYTAYTYPHPLRNMAQYRSSGAKPNIN